MLRILLIGIILCGFCFNAKAQGDFDQRLEKAKAQAQKDIATCRAFSQETKTAEVQLVSVKVDLILRCVCRNEST